MKNINRLMNHSLVYIIIDIYLLQQFSINIFLHRSTTVGANSIIVGGEGGQTNKKSRQSRKKCVTLHHHMCIHIIRCHLHPLMHWNHYRLHHLSCHQLTWHHRHHLQHHKNILCATTSTTINILFATTSTTINILFATM